jgi:hypothetical protein
LLPTLLAAAVAVPMLHADAVPAFGSPVLVTSKDMSEPGIDIAPDGTIYVNAPGGIVLNGTGPGPSFLFRSTNGGTSFVETSNLTRLAGPGGGDSDLVVTPSGHLAWTDLWLGSSSVASDPIGQGDVWVTNPFQGVAAQDRQWLASTRNVVDGLPTDIVYHVTHQIEGGLVVSKSFDGGVTYPVNNLAASPVDQGYCLCFPGNMIAESGNGPLDNGVAGTLEDKVGLIYPTGGGGPTGSLQGVGFAKSVDGGLTWTHSAVATPSSASRQGVFPVVANAGGNNLVAVWYENGKVALSRSTNWGDTWSAATYVSGSDSAVLPWVDARNGKVAVAYYGKVGSDWFVRYTESTDGGATFSSPVSADSARVKHNNPCLQGLDCNGDRELGDFLQVAIDGAGKANIVYVHSYETSTVVGVAGNGLLFNNTELRYVKQS